MGKDYQASPSEIAHVTRVGARSVQPNGDIVHVGRHPSSPDHEITVVTRGNKVMQARATFKPLSQISKIEKEKKAQVKARQDRSKAAQKAQLEKKRARTPKPKNK